MPTRYVGHHDKPSPGVCGLGHGHHPPDCLPKRFFEGIGHAGGPGSSSESIPWRESAQPFFWW